MAFLTFQYPFVSCSETSNKAIVLKRQVGVGRKVKVKATVFISWQMTFHILFFCSSNQLNLLLTLNQQNIIAYVIAF